MYQKAPAILKQLEFWLGSGGVPRWATDLFEGPCVCERAVGGPDRRRSTPASGKDVSGWADAWVLRRGMPEVTAAWTCTAGKLSHVELQQKDVLPDGFVWPISTKVYFSFTATGAIPMLRRVDFSTPTISIRAMLGKPCPTSVLANRGDEAYGRFLLDSRSEAEVRRSILGGALRADDSDPLLRSQLWGSLWDNVHVAASSPRSYVELVLANLPSEADETQARIQGGHATYALHSYMTANGRAPLVAKLESIARVRMLTAPTVGLRIVSLRTFVGIAETEAARRTLKDLLAGTVVVPGVPLRPLDRWGMVGKLVSLGDADAMTLVAAERAQDKSGEGDKYAFAALAGSPDVAVKAKYFALYAMPPVDEDAKPEDWLTQSLRPFNSWNESALTEPYLTRALDQLPEIKKDRKIFFLGAWLGAFFGGQVDAEAQAAVTRWLAQPGLDRGPAAQSP